MPSFTRQLGRESGVQYNPLVDLTEFPIPDKFDINMAIALRLPRGRIDKPFITHKDNVRIKTGKPESMRSSALNEAHVHLIEALDNGVYSAVVQRLSTSAASVKWAVAKIGIGATFTATVALGAVTAITVGAGGTGYVTGQTLTVTGGGGSGAVLTVTAAAGVITAVAVTSGGTLYATAPTVTAPSPVSWAVAETLPVTPYLVAVKHLGCFNDGIICQITSEENRVQGTNLPNDKVVLVVTDKIGVKLASYTGSLDPDSLNDYGESDYLPDVVATYTDEYEVHVGSSVTEIPINSNAYGNDVNGLAQWAKSDVLICFLENGTAYTTDDYVAARVKLRDTNYGYGYISSGGSQSPALLYQLKQLVYDVDRMLWFDVGTGLDPDSAISFFEQLNMVGDTNKSLLCQAFWTSFKSRCPEGINGKTFIGTATLAIAYACARNSMTNAYGYCVNKKSPVAGKDYPVNRQGMSQEYDCGNFVKDKLARAKINPVINESYSGGARYVFFDSLTCASVSNSKSMMSAVIDMTTDVQERITTYGKGLLQKDMDTVVDKMNDFLDKMRSELKASGWVTMPQAGNPAKAKDYFAYKVERSATQLDKVYVTIYPCYTPTMRQMEFTQVLV